VTSITLMPSNGRAIVFSFDTVCHRWRSGITPAAGFGNRRRGGFAPSGCLSPGKYIPNQPAT
jgi:hypothetical protein